MYLGGAGGIEAVRADRAFLKAALAYDESLGLSEDDLLKLHSLGSRVHGLHRAAGAPIVNA